MSRIGSAEVLIYREEFVNAVQVGYLEHRLHYRTVPLSDVFLETLISSVLAQSCHSPAYNAGWLIGWFMGLFERRSRQAQAAQARMIGGEEEQS